MQAYYLAWAIFGLVVDAESDANWAPTNLLDDLVHLWSGSSLTALAVLTLGAHPSLPAPPPA